MAKVKARIGVELTFDDNTSVKINEGNIVRGMAYKNAQKETVVMDEGAVRVICASTKAQTAGPTDCPPEPYLHKYITPTMFVMDSSDENHAILTRINISDIVSIDSVIDLSEKVTEDAIVVGPGPEFKGLDQVVADAEDGAVIQLLPGEYSAPLVLNKNVNIIGEKGTILSGPITIENNTPATMAEGADAPASETERLSVQIGSVKLTGDALVKVGAGVESFVMTDCVFGGHNIPDDTTKVMPIALTSEEPTLVIIEGNTFEDEPKSSYNLIDIYAQLTDGSSISNNEFSAKCCRHNCISLYGLDNDAEVKICENHAELSINMVRIGFKGTPKGTVYMERNSYDATDETPEYQGLFLVQPYSDKTLSFAGVNIHVVDTTYPAGTQLGYIYASGKDTPWTDDNKPAIYVDGQKVEVPAAG